MQKIAGVAIGIVREVEDPQHLGRVRVHFPWLDPDHITDWIRIAGFYGGPNKGSFFVPDPGDEVLVAFELGNARIPYVVGGLWNPKDPTPSKHPRERRLQSKNGHKIRFIDATPRNGDKGALVVEDAHGNRVVMSNGQIRLKSTAEVIIEAPSIVLKGPGYRRVVVPNSNPI